MFRTQNNRLTYTPIRRFTGQLPGHTKLSMPSLSPTMEKGNIAKWRKKEGDQINPGDILAEVETDKATVDFEMQESGYVAKLLVPEGAKDISIGDMVAILVDKKEDVAAFKDFVIEAKVAKSVPKQAEAPKEQPKPAAPKAAPVATQAAPVIPKTDKGLSLIKLI